MPLDYTTFGNGYSQKCYDESIAKNCGDGTTDGCLLWQPGPISYFNKLVGVIWRFLNHQISANTPNAQDSTDIRFYGECAANTDIYHLLTFDGGISNSIPYLMQAQSSSENYIAFFTSRVGANAYSAVVIYHVHFDPDASGCATQAYLSAPTVHSHVMRYMLSDSSSMTSMVGRQHMMYSSRRTAIFVAGNHVRFPSKSTAWTSKKISSLMMV